MKFSKPTKKIIIAAAGILIIFVACFMTNPLSFGLSDIEHNENLTNTDSNYDFVYVLGNSFTSGSVEYYYTSEHNQDITRIFEAMDKIKLNRKEISLSRDEDRPRNNIIQLGDNITVCFNEDCTQVWIDDSVKPSYSYRVKNPQYVIETFFDGPFAENNYTFGSIFSGKIVTVHVGSDKLKRYEILNNAGEYVGIVITDETQLCWQHKELFERIKDTYSLKEGTHFEVDYVDREGESYVIYPQIDSQWDIVSMDLYCKVILGDEYDEDKHWLDAENIFYADEVIITGADENYFLSDGNGDF